MPLARGRDRWRRFRTPLQPHSKTAITQAQGSHPAEASRSGCHPHRRLGYRSHTEPLTRRPPRSPGLREGGGEQQPGPIRALPQQHHAAWLPSLVGFYATDRRQREGATANQRPVGLVGRCVPQLGAAPISRAVVAHRHQDDDEDKPPTSSPNAPRPRTGLVCCGTDMATPSLLSSPMLPMWSLTSRSLGWFAARRAGLDAA
jgi:hypothetical protein